MTFSQEAAESDLLLDVNIRVKVVETSEFTLDAEALLTEFEARKLTEWLCRDPFIGESVRHADGVLFVRYLGCVVLYAVSPSLGVLYLLMIYKDIDPSPPKIAKQFGKFDVGLLKLCILRGTIMDSVTFDTEKRWLQRLFGG